MSHSVSLTTRVCLAGATGWAGSELARGIAAARDLDLVAAVSRTHAGRKLGDVLGEPRLTEEDYAEIDVAAHERKRGVLAVGNFALTVVLLQKFAEMAARLIPQWEIIDYARDDKPDAPSGTARELAARLSRVRPPEPTIPVADTVGERNARGATVSGSQIHSVRLPGYVIGAEVVFGMPDQRLTIRHDAGDSARPYVDGALLAIRKVSTLVGVHRGLDVVLEV